MRFKQRAQTRIPGTIMGSTKLRGVKSIWQIIGSSCSKSLNALLETFAPTLRKMGAENILLLFWTPQKGKDWRLMMVKGVGGLRYAQVGWESY